MHKKKWRVIKATGTAWEEPFWFQGIGTLNAGYNFWSPGVAFGTWEQAWIFETEAEAESMLQFIETLDISDVSLCIVPYNLMSRQNNNLRRKRAFARARIRIAEAA